jgi:hydroxypyruvate isomerase
MLNLSLNIEPVLTNMDFYDRVKIASDLGIKAVELWDPQEKDVAKLGAVAASNNVKVIGCTIIGIFKYTLDIPYPVLLKATTETIRLMKEMGCQSLIIFSGNRESVADSQKNIIIENLKRLSELAEKEKVTINIEPLNSLVECKGHYLDSSHVGFEIVKCVNSDYVKMVYDVYHMQVMEGNIIDNITKNIDLISHFHSAAVPGRKELYMGDNDYRNIMRAVENTGYKGYFGLEYWPSLEDHLKSLKNVLQYLKS